MQRINYFPRLVVLQFDEMIWSGTLTLDAQFDTLTKLHPNSIYVPKIER